MGSTNGLRIPIGVALGFLLLGPISHAVHAGSAPVVGNTTWLTNEDTAFTGVLAATDVDSPSVSFSIVTGPSIGTLGPIGPVSCQPSGGGSNCSVHVTYTPNPNVNVGDLFTYKANDGVLDSNTGTVQVGIYPVNDPPVLGAVSVTPSSTSEGGAVTVTGSFTDLYEPVGSQSQTYSVRISWGDGTHTEVFCPSTPFTTECPRSGPGPNQVFSFTLAHQYLDDPVGTTHGTLLDFRAYPGFAAVIAPSADPFAANHRTGLEPAAVDYWNVGTCAGGARCLGHS